LLNHPKGDSVVLPVIIINSLGGFLKMAQSTKSPEVAKNLEVAKLSESLLNTWAEGLDRVCTNQKELEDRFLQAVENQKESWGKFNNEFCSQIDVVSNQLQELTLKPYKESLSLFSQSQDQFKQSVQNSFEQQQKIREEFKNQIKVNSTNLF
jgi:hypothetical protein